MTDKKKKQIRIDQKCDYCDQKTKYIGASSFTSRVYRVCDKETCQEKATKAMKEEKNDNGEAKS